MAVHYLRYSFLRKVDVYDLDTDYQTNYTKNQLQKVFGPYNVTELTLTEVLDENMQPEEL